MRFSKRVIAIFITLLIMGGGISSALFSTDLLGEYLPQDTFPKPSLLLISDVDSLGIDESERYSHLTERDFKLVAEELDVEVAAIKAVVEIEAGKAMKGFWAPGIPVINFDRSMYNKYKNKALSKDGATGETVPEGLSGYALKEWTELIKARKTNAQGANMGTFWGMFQIGGFNYKLCGCENVDEFVKRMAYSELEQLQLFAVFITNAGMVESLRKKDWATFARKYNGPSYAKRGYHTKMAKAYKTYSKI
ncbi:MAG: N-acetylmuramidase family protein [Muribaculaceae bacterium]|nr:N-acetylmuramidase family protein [Muribaculaceae bacterium]